MNRELSEQERAERRQIVDEMMAAGGLDKLEVAYLEAYARGDLSLDEVSGRIIGRAEAKAEQVMAEAAEDAHTFMAHSEIEQQRILRHAELEAKRIQEDLGGPAERLSALLSSAENPSAAMRDLLLHGTEEQLGLTAKFSRQRRAAMTRSMEPCGRSCTICPHRNFAMYGSTDSGRC